MTTSRTHTVGLGQRAIDLDTIPGQLELDDIKAPAVDWNVCIGYKVDEHAHPAEMLHPGSFLCLDCNRRLNADVNGSREAHRAGQLAAQPARCPGGDHAPGANYYTCLACYGD